VTTVEEYCTQMIWHNTAIYWTA